MNLKTWVSRHPILTYIILTMVWSFSIWSLLFLYIKPGELMKSAPPISFLFVVLGGFGPSLSGLFTTWLAYGREPCGTGSASDVWEAGGLLCWLSQQ